MKKPKRHGEMVGIFQQFKHLGELWDLKIKLQERQQILSKVNEKKG